MMEKEKENDLLYMFLSKIDGGGGGREYNHQSKSKPLLCSLCNRKLTQLLNWMCC